MANRLKVWVSNVRDAVAASVKGLTLRDPLQAWLQDADFADGTRHVSDPYKQAVYVNTAIAILAKLVAGVPLDLVGADRKPIDDPADENLRLLRKPNALNDHRTFFERTVVLKQRDGQVFWVRAKNFERPLERAVHVVRNREIRRHVVDGVLLGWWWTRGGRREFLELERACRLFAVDPDDELAGFAGVRAAQLAIDAHTYAARYNVNTFYNGAEPGSVYTTDKTLTPEQREQLERRIEKRHQGVENVAKAMILGGGLKRDSAPQSNADLQYIDGQRLTAHQQIAPLHVQPIYAALFENVNYNTASVQERLQWDLAVLPELHHLVECWNLFCVAPVDPGKAIVPDLDSVPVLQARELERVDQILALQKHNIPLNVLIETFNLQIPKQPWGDEPLVGAGQTPISVVFGEAEAAIAAGNQPEGGEENAHAETQGAQGERFMAEVEADWNRLQTVLKADSETRKRRRLWEAWDRSYLGLRRTARRKIRAFLIRQANETIARLKKVGLPKSGQRLAGGGQQHKGELETWLARIVIDLRVENDKVTALGRFLVREGLDLGGTQAGREVEMPDDWAFNLENPAVKRRLQTQALRVRKINKTTQEVLRRALLKGLEGNETVNEIGKRVAGAMGIRSGRQSWRIANTEMHEAMAAGRHEGFRQANVKRQAWLTSQRGVEPDGPTRKSHYGCEQATKASPLEVGAQFRLWDPDLNAESFCRYPGEGVLPPGERVNCSCNVLARMTAAGKELTVEAYLERGFVTYEERQEQKAEGKRQEARGAGA